jgi:hypothetical protein
LRQYGIDARPKTCKLSNRKYDYNRGFLKNISPDIAWVLGLLVSDGFVRENNQSAYFGLKLSIRDEDVIVKVRNILGYNGPIHKVVSKLEHKGMVKEFHSRLLQIYDVRVVKELERMGIVQNKTYNEKMPDCIVSSNDENVISSFIRGVYDGDGSVMFDHRRKSMCFQVVGSRRMLGEIQDQLMRFCNIKKTKLTNNIVGTDHYALRYRGNLQAARIIGWLYSSSNPTNRMDRKFEKFCTIKNGLGGR